MKKLLGIVLLMVLLVNCNSKAEKRYASSSAEIDQITSLIETYEAGNWDAWKGHYADTAKIYHNSLEPVTSDELMASFKESLADMESYQFQDEDLFKEMVIDDRGRTWVNMWGTWEGVIRENKQKIQIPVHLTAQFIDGKIVEEHAYYNMEPIIMAMMELEKTRDTTMAE